MVPTFNIAYLRRTMFTDTTLFRYGEEKSKRTKAEYLAIEAASKAGGENALIYHTVQMVKEQVWYQDAMYLTMYKVSGKSQE